MTKFLVELVIVYFCVGLLIPYAGIAQRGIHLPVELDSLPQSQAVYGVLVGISDYSYLRPLKYADDDAILFKQFLESRAGGGVPDSNLILLLNKQATMASFLGALDQLLAKTKKGDKVYIYLAGHGDASGPNRYYFLPYDCRPGNSTNHYNATGAIRMGDVKDAIEDWTRAGVQVILIVDACRTGELPGGLQGVNGFVNNILEKKAGDMMLISASPNQTSIEDAAFGGGHGLFTFYLVRGLSGEADFDNDQKVTFYELENYVKTKVPAASKSNQIPVFCCSEHYLSLMSRVDSIFSDRIVAMTDLEKGLKGSMTGSEARNGGEYSDTTGIFLYNQLVTAIESGRFKGPKGASSIMDKIIERCVTCPVTKEAQRELAIAYLNYGQTLINLYLSGEDSKAFTRSFIDIEADRKFELEKWRKKRFGLLAQIDQLTLTKNQTSKGVNAQKKKLKGKLDQADLVLKYAVDNSGRANLFLEHNQELSFLEAASWMRLALKWLANDVIYKPIYQPKIDFLELYGLQSDIKNKDSVNLRLDSLTILDSSSYILNLAAKTWMKFGLNEKAYFHLNRAISQADDWAYPYNNMGELLDIEKKFTEAEKWYRKAIALDSNFIYPYNNLGLNLESQKRFPEAVEVYLSAIKRDPNFVMTYNNLGHYYFKKGKYDLALTYFKRATEIDTLHIFSVENLLNVALAREDMIELQQWGNRSKALYQLLSPANTVADDPGGTAIPPEKYQDSDSDGIPDHQDKCPSQPGVLSWKGCPIGPNSYVDSLAGKMMLVDGGEFKMGCSSKEVNCDHASIPVHDVELSPYYIGDTEVTVAQFRLFIQATNYITEAEVMGGVDWRYDASGKLRPKEEDNHPVVYVSWNDAIAYTTWLGQQTNEPYRLPYEAEWEYAARGGSAGKGSDYAGSKNVGEVAWYDKNAAAKTHNVRDKKNNELGIYGMSGNVWEWCQDWYDDYTTGKVVDPKGPVIGRFKVRRGGSWNSMGSNCTVYYRGSSEPSVQNRALGFRIAKSAY
jgi:formylglycine-generating enzyme required for sulfatase activity/tetratricopeptide (TPR) repeat protein